MIDDTLLKARYHRVMRNHAHAFGGEPYELAQFIAEHLGNPEFLVDESHWVYIMADDVCRWFKTEGWKKL